MWELAPRAAGGGGGVPAGSARTTVWVTVTSGSSTVPQLVTVGSAVTVPVGASWEGVVPATADSALTPQPVPTVPGAPEATAGGVRPTAVITS